jgi:hypothetical protein
MNDGSASECSVQGSAAACQAACAGYDQHHFQPDGVPACEGPDQTLLVTYERDIDDIDNDPNTNIIRWRYVVVINDCRVVNGVCEEKHQLWRCWSDARHNCTNASAIGPAYWVPIGTGCQCTQVDQSTYPGCGSVNYHYWVYCRSSQYTTYYSEDDPGEAPPPDDPWSEAGPHGVPFPTDAGDSVWIGRPNLYVATNQKQWTIEITGKSADAYGVASVAGYDNNDPPGQVPVAAVTSVSVDPGPPKKLTITITFRPQPQWEKAEIQRVTQGQDGPVYLKVKSYSHCTHVATTGDQVELRDGRFGIPGVDDYRITSIYLFPDQVPVRDVGHAIVAPSDTGIWYNDLVWIDPQGEPHFTGGVHFWTEGEGLTPDDLYTLWLTMAGPAADGYTMYAFDAAIGEYQYYRVEVEGPNPVPTDEDPVPHELP